MLPCPIIAIAIGEYLAENAGRQAEGRASMTDGERQTCRQQRKELLGEVVIGGGAEAGLRSQLPGDWLAVLGDWRSYKRPLSQPTSNGRVACRRRGECVASVACAQVRSGSGVRVPT